MTHPFPDDEVGAIMRASERIVCGGWTHIEWSQHGRTEVAFSCTHGPQCSWRIFIGDAARHGLILLAEMQYADRLHREHAWRALGEQAAAPT